MLCWSDCVNMGIMAVDCGRSLLSVCFQDVCKIVVQYCNILKERVRVLSEKSDPGSAINMVSTD